MEKNIKSDVLFTIVIPSYNRALFIKETINSVLNQNYENYEIIVVDDGSTDNTREIITCMLNEPRIRYFYIVNGERGRARNFGFSQAKGDYILFLDSDDLMLPNHLEVLKAKIDEAAKPNFIATKYQLKRGSQVRSNEIGVLGEGWYDVNSFLMGNFLACNIRIRRNNPMLKLFEEDRKFAVVEDWMFMLQNFVYDKVYLVDKNTILMNDHDQRSMRSDDKVLINKLLSVLDWVKLNVKLSKDQFHKLVGHVYYLCAIHAYSGEDRKMALQYLIKAATCISFDLKLFSLMIKILIGKKVVNWAKAKAQS